MPQSCPHCGVALTGVIDAYCPECREDLSATPEEAREAAENTFNAVMGTETPEAAREKSAGYSLMLTGGAATGLIVSAVAHEWGKALLGGVLLVLGVAWMFGEHRHSVVKTRVTGTSKTNKSSEPT